MTLTNLQRDRGMCISFFEPAGVASTSPKYEVGKVPLVACFSSVKNHNVSGPHLFPSFSTHAKKIPLTPRTVLHWAKNPFATGRNSERCFYHIDLSWFVLPVSDPSALNCSQFVGFQDSPNLSKIEKVAENRDFDGKETLMVKRAMAISKRVLGWKWIGCTLSVKFCSRNTNYCSQFLLKFCWEWYFKE